MFAFRSSILATIAIAGMLAIVAEAVAQEPAALNVAMPEAERQLILQAYQLSTRASTVQQYTQVIGHCEQADTATLPSPARAYAHKLRAWAHNSRGEALTDLANDGIQAAADANPAEARDLNAAADEARLHALKDYQQAVKLDPAVWKHWHNLGVGSALAGDLKTAESSFTRAINLHKQYANTWFNRAEVRYRSGAYAQAVADYTMALQLRPTDPAAITARGHANYRLGQYEAAINDYAAANQLLPLSASVAGYRADCHYHLSQWAMAVKWYRQSLSLKPGNVRKLQNLAWLLAVCPDAKVRHPQQAIANAVMAARISPNDFRIQDTLAAAYASHGQFDQAIVAAQRAIELGQKKASPAEMQQMRQRLDLYRRGQPYVAESAPAKVARKTSG